MAGKSSGRRDITAQKEALAQDLRLASRRAGQEPGKTMVSVRELSARYGLTLRTVSQELQKLAREGVLYTIPRVGTFVAAPPADSTSFFLAIFPSETSTHAHFAAIRSGFEERLAHLGAPSLVLDAHAAQRLQATTALGRPAGIFEVQTSTGNARWQIAGVPHVWYGQNQPKNPQTDCVNFDNVEGGHLATRHLLALGHKRIAFLGLHGTSGPIGVFTWSRERAAGWEGAMVDTGQVPAGLCFHPELTCGPQAQDQYLCGLAQARLLLEKAGCTAVVAVNANAARGLLAALRESGREPESWPAIVSFDTESLRVHDDAVHLLTALRLPWEELGRNAANLLWERSQGKLPPEGQVRHAIPSLIPRLSCRPGKNWHPPGEPADPATTEAVVSP